MFVCVCVWPCRVATAAWKTGEGKNRKKKPPGYSGNPYTPGFRATQQEEVLSQLCYGCLGPFSAVL